MSPGDDAPGERPHGEDLVDRSDRAPSADGVKEGEEGAGLPAGGLGMARSQMGSTEERFR